MDTVLTPAALAATRGLVRLVLQRERQISRDHRAGSDQLPSHHLQQQLDAVPSEALLAAIRRHRLACVIHGDPLVATLLPRLVPTIQALARQDAMAALALASLTRELAALFEQAAIPLLVIKGIPLALQTTDSLTARGRGDLDLLVDPRRLPEAVALLESAGFSRCPGQFPHQLHSAWGRYGQWAYNQFSLVRQGQAGTQWIDLHWALSIVRAPLPSFSQAWQDGEVLNLNGQAVFTLSRLHAFQHACSHAAQDQWMCLRNLVDIDRLADQLPGLDRIRLRHQPMVGCSAAVTHAVTGNEALGPLHRGTGPGSTHALVRAAQAQLLPWRSQGPGPWTPRHWATTVQRMLVMSHDPRDWLRILLLFSLPPAACSDPATGEALGLAGVLRARIQRLSRRLNEPRCYGSTRPRP